MQNDDDKMADGNKETSGDTEATPKPAPKPRVGPDAELPPEHKGIPGFTRPRPRHRHE